QVDDDRAHIAELSDFKYMPLDLCMISGEDEECSTKTSSSGSVEDGTKCTIRVSNDSHQGYIGVTRHLVRVLKAYDDAAIFKVIKDSDKVRISYRDEDNSE
ncbi:hypothetical protein BGZ93_002772, partial [Podila epicladia]